MKLRGFLSSLSLVAHVPGFAFTYQKQWNNPRPGVAIASVDLEYGKDRRGVPVILALTAGESK